MHTLIGGRRILMHGMLLVLVGLVWGLAVPAAPYPRLALGAHIQLVTNGMLLMVLATALLALPNRVGPKSVWVMQLAAFLTWGMALSEVANSWWGTRGMLPIAAGEAGAAGGASWQELIVTLAHLGAGFGLIAAWLLLVAGFLRAVPRESSAGR
ncbi:MAG: hypothetical protein ACKOYN_02900 [Planctomycetota bacterium]